MAHATGSVQWNERESHPFATVDELGQILDRLSGRARHLGERRMVMIEVRGRGSLGIGLGEEETVLTHIPEDGMPPYHNSLGDETRPGLVWFEFMDEGSEFSESELVPTEQGRAAARHWLQTGELSIVEWHEV